jgi:hypothetical protein
VHEATILLELIGSQSNSHSKPGAGRSVQPSNPEGFLEGKDAKLIATTFWLDFVLLQFPRSVQPPRRTMKFPLLRLDKPPTQQAGGHMTFPTAAPAGNQLT